MSDRPSDPFGRAERTVLRPNPAGRRAPAPPSPASPPPPPAAWPPASPNPPAPAAWPAAPGPPRPEERPRDEWATPSPAPPPPKALVLRRDVVVAPNENPLLGAAGPLLLLLGRLRVALSRASFAHLMEQVAAAIEDFERDVRAGGLDERGARTAKYVLCATADDIVQNLPGDDRHVWTQYSMLSRFFGERTGGVRFFEELERAKVDPAGNYNLLELMHACLALGFQGIHRTSSGGAAALQQIQRNLYELLRRVRRPNPELSPRWRGQSLATEAARFRIPVWSVASLVGLFLLGLYLTLRFLLGGEAETVSASLVAVHPTTELAIRRQVFKAPPPPPPPAPKSPQIKCIQTALAEDIAAGRLSVDEKQGQIIIRVANLVLFASGDATIRDEFKTILGRLVAVLDKEEGGIKVVGHTDNAALRPSARFPSNFHLSVERANAVAVLLKRGLAKPERVEVEGKGPDAPVASNDTPDGRARNRRVEIAIPRTERGCSA